MFIEIKGNAGIETLSQSLKKMTLISTQYINVNNITSIGFNDDIKNITIKTIGGSANKSYFFKEEADHEYQNIKNIIQRNKAK